MPIPFLGLILPLSHNMHTIDRNSSTFGHGLSCKNAGALVNAALFQLQWSSLDEEPASVSMASRAKSRSFGCAFAGTNALRTAIQTWRK